MSLFSSPPPELFALAAAASNPTAAAQAAAVIDSADHPPLRGRGLRWVLLDELKRHTQLTVAAMARILRITVLARRSRDWITAVRSQRTPVPFPQTWRDRKHAGIPIPPASPPWTVYGWLWNT